MSTVMGCIAPLFVPAHRPDRFDKAARSGADALVLDLEDAVPPEQKAEARLNLRGDFDLPVIVRINAVGTPWHAEDLAAIRRLRPATIMVPKAGGGLTGVVQALDAACPIIALIESAEGLSMARAIAGEPRVIRLAFGTWDYCADLGCAHERDALLTARSEIVLASRLAGLPAPLDGVTTAHDDDAQAEADACHARALGFGGKLLIHPRQVGSVLKGFMPTQQEIAWAENVLASQGAVASVAGAMVDEPVRARARALMSRSRRRLTEA